MEGSMKASQHKIDKKKKSHRWKKVLLFGGIFFLLWGWNIENVLERTQRVQGMVADVEKKVAKQETVLKVKEYVQEKKRKKQQLEERKEQVATMVSVQSKKSLVSTKRDENVKDSILNHRPLFTEQMERVDKLLVWLKQQEIKYKLRETKKMEYFEGQEAMEHLLGEVIYLAEEHGEQENLQMPNQLPDELLLEAIWHMNETYHEIPAKHQILLEKEYSPEFITVDEMDEIVKELFGTKLQDGTTSIWYRHETIYGSGYEMVKKEDETMGMACINGIQQKEEGIEVTFSAVKVTKTKDSFYGNYQAMLIENEKSPLGYRIGSIKKKKSQLKPIKEVTASSYLKTKEGSKLSYTPKNVVDRDLKTTWSEGVKGDGKGQWLKIQFPNQTKVSAIILYGGYQKSEETFRNNGIPDKIKLQFSDKTTEILDTTAYTNYYMGEGKTIMLFPKIHKTSYVKVSVLKAKTGEKYDDTCISEIEFY